jgi:uncharacterized protein YndB with AHSA1/START domain
MSRLTLVRRISAPPAMVYEALVTPQGMAAWWGPDEGLVLKAESDPRIGGSYRVRFRMEDGTEHEAAGIYLVVDAPRRLVMSFQWTGSADDRGLTQIEITLKAMGKQTELKFVHAKFQTEETRKSHEQGWSGALGKLERHFRDSPLNENHN